MVAGTVEAIKMAFKDASDQILGLKNFRNIKLNHGQLFDANLNRSPFAYLKNPQELLDKGWKFSLIRLKKMSRKSVFPFFVLFRGIRGTPRHGGKKTVPCCAAAPKFQGCRAGAVEKFDGILSPVLDQYPEGDTDKNMTLI